MRINGNNKITRDIIIMCCMILGLAIRVMYCIKYPIQPRDAYTYKTIIFEEDEMIREKKRNQYYSTSLWIQEIPHRHFACDIMKSGIVVNMILGVSLICIAMYFIDNLYHNIFLTLVTGLCFATHPTLVHFSCTFLRENTYLFFSAISLIGLYKYCKERKVLYLAISSIFGCISFLCRLEGYELAVFFLITVVFYTNKYQSLSNKFFHVLAYLLFFVSTWFVISSLLDLDINSYNILEFKIRDTMTGI